MESLSTPFFSSLPESLQPFCTSSTLCEFESELKRQPEKLASFLKEAAVEEGWIRKETLFAKRLFSEMSAQVRKGTLSLEKGIDAINFLIRSTPKSLPYLVESDFSLRDPSSKTEIKISSLVFLRHGTWFQTYFMGNFQESQLTQTEYGRFASEVDLPVLKRLIDYLMTDHEAALDELEPAQLWRALVQCHLWGLTSVSSILQNKLTKHILTPSEALEYLPKANFYDFKELILHCTHILQESRIHLSPKKDGTLRASFREPTPENLAALKEFSNSISHMSLSLTQLSSPHVKKALPTFNHLTGLTLKLPPRELSKIAQETLLSLTSLQSLRVTFKNISPCELSLPKGPSFSPSHGLLINLNRLEFTKAPASFKEGSKSAQTLSLALVALAPHLSDLSLGSIHFIDDPFMSQLMALRPPLKRLDMRMCRNVSDSTLLKLPLAFPHLEELHLRAHPLDSPVTLSALLQNFKKLTHLDLQGCSRLPEGILDNLKGPLTRFKTLNFFGIKNLSQRDFESLMGSAQELESLNLAYCPELRYSMMRTDSLPQLKELTVSSTFFEDEEEVMQLRGRRPLLARLTLEGPTTPLMQIKLSLAGF